MADQFQIDFEADFQAATGESVQTAVGNGFEGIDPEILVSAVSALQAYAASPEGKAALANANLDPSMLGHLFGGDLNSSAFQTLINDMQKYDPIKAVSLGIMGQVEFIVGVSGTVGYAVDLQNLGTTSAVYAGGGIVEGLDGGGEISLCLGLWAEETADINGFYVGIEGDITDVGGLSVVAFASKGDKDKLSGEDGGINLKYAKMIFVGIDIGVDDGVEGDEYYFFAGHLSQYPAFQSGPYDYMVMLENMHCDNEMDALGDDVHMLYTVDGGSTQYRYPIWNDVNMDEDSHDNWSCGNMIKFNDSFELKLIVNGKEVDQKDNQSYTASEFSGLGSTVNKDFYRKSGLSVTEYHVAAQLIAAPS